VYGVSFDDGRLFPSDTKQKLSQSAPTSRAIAKSPVRECARRNIRIAPVVVRFPTSAPNLAVPVWITWLRATLGSLLS